MKQNMFGGKCSRKIPGRAACIVFVCALSFSSFTTIHLTAAGEPLADLKAAVTALETKRDPRHSETALAVLKPLSAKLPKLADYIAWFTASAQFDAENYIAVPQTLEPVFAQRPASPLAGRAFLLGAQAYEKSNRAADAVMLLKRTPRALPQPQGDLEMAKALMASGDGTGAAVFAQRVYNTYPSTPEAVEAEALMLNLRNDLGSSYPPVLGSTMLARAVKLLNSGEPLKARRELVALQSQLSGPELETVRVKIGVADYMARNTAAAQRYLRDLQVTSPAADSERIYYLLLCARRTDDRDGIDSQLAQLSKLYPASPFRLEGLISSANSFLVDNRADDYEPLYSACYASFTRDSKASTCHWKVVWAHYLQRRDDAPDLLREHVRVFPDSDETPAALYYLGRLAEAASDAGTARAYYNEVARQYPNRYYGVVARTRLKQEATGTTVVALPPAFLRDINFAPRMHTRNFEPNTTSRWRLDRARLLASAGLDDWWDVELRFAAQNEDQPHVTGLELARLESTKDAPDRALRDLKRYVPDYLSLPYESVPDDFWRIAFPLPYRTALERYSRENNLDPFLVAALIRQESEFNPKAISVANARGLTQIMPGTGRELSRRLALRPYALSYLFQPQVNLRLGTYYLKSIADKLDGRWEAALAAYNAGLTRANAWSTWGEFREPSEFVETVPFSQTRDYIQIVLRNADMYRRIYGESKAIAVAAPTQSQPATQVSYSPKAPVRRSTPSKAQQSNVTR